VPERSAEGAGSSSRESSSERQQGARRQAATAEGEHPPVVEGADADAASCGSSSQMRPTASTPSASTPREQQAYERFAPSVLGRSTGLSTPTSESTDHTQRASTLSYNSATEDTPPPSSVPARRRHGTASRHGAAPQAALTQDAATTELLMNVLQAQTTLLSALGRSGFGTPQLDARSLFEALQAASQEDRLSSCSPSSPSRGSSGYTLPDRR